jgi:uncharacterized caspase-like protein
LLVYFAGHGAPTADGQALLLPWDANPAANRLERSSVLRESWLEKAKAAKKRLLLILDACFSGQSGSRSFVPEGSRGFGTVLRETVPSQGVGLLSATSSNQTSQETAQGGIFTTALISALSGAADTNRDGVVTLQEVFAFTKNQVAETSRNQQVPEQLGDFVMAQDPNTVSTRSIEARVAKITALGSRLKPQQFLALKRLIENQKEPPALRDFIDGTLSPEDFLELVYTGYLNEFGVPSGKP